MYILINAWASVVCVGYPYLKLFFISRSLAMTLTGSVSPVAFWISGSSTLMKRLCACKDQLHVPAVSGKGGKGGQLVTFSSPMVNLPVVT